MILHLYRLVVYQLVIQIPLVKNGLCTCNPGLGGPICNYTYLTTPTDFIATMITQTLIEITWITTPLGQVPDFTEIDISSTGSYSNTINSTTQDYNISNLAPGTTFSITIKTHNFLGFSPNVTIIVATLPTYGCTDSTAVNYNSSAQIDNGSCNHCGNKIAEPQYGEQCDSGFECNGNCLCIAPYVADNPVQPNCVVANNDNNNSIYIAVGSSIGALCLIAAIFAYCYFRKARKMVESFIDMEEHSKQSQIFDTGQGNVQQVSVGNATLTTAADSKTNSSIVSNL